MTLNLTIDSRSLDHRTVLCKHNMMWPIAMYVVVFYCTTSVLFWVKLLLFWTAKMVNTKLLVLINWNTQVNNYSEIAVVKSSTCCYSLVMWSFVIRRWSRHNKRHAMFKTDHVNNFLWSVLKGYSKKFNHQCVGWVWSSKSLLRWETVS